MTMTIRQATHDDIEALLALRHEVAGEGVWIAAELPLDTEGDRARFAATIDAEPSQAASLLASLDDGTIVGHLSIHQRIGIADLGMNVASGHRGAGIGAALLGSAIDWARWVGCHKIQLEHWPWNERARRLYERFGFVEECYRQRQYRRKDGSLWDAVLTGLILDDREPGHDPTGHRAAPSPGVTPGSPFLSPLVGTVARHSRTAPIALQAGLAASSASRTPSHRGAGTARRAPALHGVPVRRPWGGRHRSPAWCGSLVRQPTDPGHGRFPDILDDQLRKAKVTDRVVLEALRLGGITSRTQVQAVIIERNGTFSVIRTGDPIDPELVAPVSGSKALRLGEGTSPS